MAYRYAREFIDRAASDHADDPELNMKEDAWHPVEYREDDSEFEGWENYKLIVEQWDPDVEDIVRTGEFVDAWRPENPIEWDKDLVADPRHVLGDGSVYFLADPHRPVPDNFDQVFKDNDDEIIAEAKRRQALGLDQPSGGGDRGNDGSKDPKVVSRPKEEFSRLGRNRRQSPNNIVDPWGRRNPRRGLREKADNQNKAILERMKRQEEMLSGALEDLNEAFGPAPTVKRESTPPPPSPKPASKKVAKSASAKVDTPKAKPAKKKAKSKAAKKSGTKSVKAQASEADSSDDTGSKTRAKPAKIEPDQPETED